MLTTLKTRQVCAEAPVSYSTLTGLLRSGRLAAPPKDASGDFVWTTEDLPRIRAALRLDRRFKGGRKPAEGAAHAPA
jgi:hypothetical protein